MVAFSGIERTSAVVIFCAKCFVLGMYLFAFEQSIVNLKVFFFFKQDL